MKRRSFLVLCIPLLCCSCGHHPMNPGETITTSVVSKVERAGAKGSLWGLHQLNKLNHRAAVEAAKLLKKGSVAGVDFLEDPATQRTAEQINKYLIGLLLKNINPAVGAGIDIAAGILDDILQVPVGTTLTKAELEVIAAFVKGLGEGADQFLAGKSIDSPPERSKSMRSRHWLHAEDGDRK